MARDDILSRDYVAPSRPIIQDTRKSEMWEKLLADSMDLLKMQTLSSQEIAREERAEGRAERTAVRSLQDARSLLETKAELEEEGAQSEYDRKDEERTRERFDAALIGANAAAAGNQGIWITELEALKEMPAYERYLTEIDRKITNAKRLQGFDRARSRAEQEVSELITPAALMKGPKAAEDALTAIHQKWPEGHILAGQPVFSAATRNSKSAALQVSLRSIGDESDPLKQMLINLKEITKIDGYIIDLDQNIAFATTEEAKKPLLKQRADLIETQNFYKTLNANIQTLQRTKGLGTGLTGEKLYNQQVDYYKTNYNLGDTPEGEKVAIEMLTNYVAGVEYEDDKQAEDHQKMIVAQYGPDLFDIDWLKDLRTKRRKSMKAEKLGPPEPTVTTPSIVTALTDTTVTVPTDTTGMAPTDTTGIVPPSPPAPPAQPTGNMEADRQRALDAFDAETPRLMKQYSDEGYGPKALENWQKKRAKQREEISAQYTELSTGGYQLNGKPVQITKKGDNITLRADKDVIQASFGVDKNRITAHPTRKPDEYQQIMEMFQTGALVRQTKQ
jgi:hypothetical protein